MLINAGGVWTILKEWKVVVAATAKIRRFRANGRWQRRRWPGWGEVKRPVGGGGSTREGLRDGG
uniref:Uncharacterized protein n=1 Tax=Arundo donax TaxID=35708 RepID=A0A0A9C6Q8_ARUDO